MTKEEYLNILREDPVFKTVMSRATDDVDKRRIKAYTEDFMMKFFEVFKNVDEAKSRDPAAIAKAVSELREELLRKASP